MKYIYPAIFTPEGNGLISVSFPDIDQCYTSGDDLIDAMEMAQDVLSFRLYQLEKEKKEIVPPSDLSNLTLSDGEFANLIVADVDAYKRRFNDKSVKKTLTIPKWLNEEAVEKGLNFSKVLQDALVHAIANN